MKIDASELLLTDKGAVYHLDVRPGQLSDKIIIVGDPGRVTQIAQHLENIECDISHREFHTVTGWYKGKRVTAMSTGIGSDNVDILMTEVDALFNIDFGSREVKKELKNIDFIRLGTCGAVSDDLDFGDFVISNYAIGIDGMLNYYKKGTECRLTDIEDSFMRQMDWSSDLPHPYAVAASVVLSDRFKSFAKPGFTLCCDGFFGPQGRTVRLAPVVDNMIERLMAVDCDGLRLTNIEMEGAAVMGMAQLLGHRATTVCLVLAHRTKKGANIDYSARMDELIIKTLELI